MADSVVEENESADLTPLQHKTLRVLLTKGTVPETLKIVGISRATLSRWLKQPAFKGALQEYSNTVLDSIARQLILYSEDSLALLARTVNNGDVAISVRVRAAEAILGNMLKVASLVSIEKRLQDLEEAEGTNDYVQSTPAYQDIGAAEKYGQ